MSHFSVLVVTKDSPSKAALSEALQPFHEFECTGTVDEYVQSVDETEQMRAEYAGSGSDKTFLAWLSEYTARPVLAEDTIPDTAGACKWGWIRKDAAGDVKEVIDRTNPNAKWDWWTVGGRWAGFFALKAAASAESARKCDIDFAGMRAMAEEDARREWQTVRAAVGDLSDFVPWKTMVRTHIDVDYARAKYWAQPHWKSLRENRDMAFKSIDDVLCTEDEYAAKARANACLPFAFLQDGQWAERGKMGWFACVSNEKEDWPEAFQALLDNVPDDHWLTVVDCHI